MSFQHRYSPDHPDLATVESTEEPLLLEFGTNWCGHCQAAQPLIETAFQDHPALRHIKVEDGKGRPLGRAFKVKLWPTLILLRRGEELGRVVRPGDQEAVRRVLSLGF